MRSFWIYGAGLALVFVVGSAVYSFFPKGPFELADPGSSSSTRTPSADSNLLIVPAKNPLLIADVNQLRRWIPMYPIRCGEIIFERADTKSSNYSFCIGEIKKRVGTATGYQISQDEVLDPLVGTHWRALMKAK
jgi:hypothetical protein